MQTYKGLPVYTAGLDEECEITTISLVESPAMELPLFTFGEEKAPLQFSIADEGKHNIISCIVRVDYPIYRIGSSGFGYYMIFQSPTALELCRRLMRDGYHNCVSKDHDGQLIEGIQLEEVFIKDVKRGISPSGYEDAADGSLFGIYHITDEELWKECVEGKFGGVSLESYLTLEPADETPKENIFNKFNNGIFEKYNFFNMKLRDKIVKMLLKFDSVSTDKADLFYDHEGELAVGDEVYSYDESGERTAVEDGEYVSDGYVYVIKDSKVEEIREKETPIEEEVEAEEAVIVDTPVVEEVKPTADPELIARIDALEARIAELEAKIETISKEPVTEPVVEEFEKVSKRDSSTNKYVRMFSAK